MNVNLDPVVIRTLQQFARRRFWLLVARGLCSGLVTFVCCLITAGFIDWYWLLTDAQRWALAGFVYLPVVAVIWRTSVRHLLHQPARKELASHVEELEPTLREKLLAAVELAVDDSQAIHDSPVFRALVQQEVAEQAGRIRISGLLPVRMLSRWIAATSVIIACAGWMLSSSDGRFRQLAVRALLPSANIARVSRIQVDVLQPTPNSLMLAEDETVSVVVAISGGTVDEVILETSTQKQGLVRQPMRLRADAEFIANIHVADESVDYRILAGDAVTERFRLESRSRPRVISFQKRLEFPDYSLLPDKTLIENHGDLVALQGTRAELLLQLDQQVSQAELRVDAIDSDDVLIIPLTPVIPSPAALPAKQVAPAKPLAGDSGQDAGGRAAATVQWKAVVSIDQAAIYKVHLVSKETGFENIFSPKYEIRPQPDLIPRAGFVDQQENSLLLPPNEIVALKAMAEDDLPLVRLEQHVSVNGDEWLVLPLIMEPVVQSDGLQVTAAWQWDLINHQLKPGDQVVTKLVAVDRKGSTGESIPLRVVVADQQFDPERHTLMESKLSLVEHLAAFAELLEEHKASAGEVITRLQDPQLNVQQAMVEQSALLDIVGRQRDQADGLLAKIREVTGKMPAGADAYELDLAGRVIARVSRDHANSASLRLRALLVRARLASHSSRAPDGADQLQADQLQADQLKKNLDELQRTFERMADDAKNLSAHYQNTAAFNFLNALAMDLDLMLQQQKFIVNSPTQTWQRLVRQETIVISQLRGIERLVQLHRSALPAFLDGHMVSLLNWSESQRDRLQFAMESEDQLDHLQKASREVLTQLEQRQRMDAVDGGLPARLINAWRDLDNRSGSLYLPIEQLARAIEQENRLMSEATQAVDSVAGQKLTEQAGQFADQVDVHHRRSLDQLRIRRQLTQLRSDADSQYAADAGLTFRAAISLINQHRTGLPNESTIASSLLEVAPAYRTLEAGHQLIAVRDLLNQLLEMERWGSQNLESHIDHPRQWDLVQRLLELSSQRLREARIENALIGPLDELRWSAAARDASRKISERRWKREAIISASHELSELQGRLNNVVESIQPSMTAAREVIAKYAPTISEMAEQAAVQVRQMEEQTTLAADQLEDTADDNVSDQSLDARVVADSRMAELKERQQSINSQIDDLLEALVEDANSQDLLDESQRERARDADDSIAMISQPAEQMNREIQQALESQETAQQVTELAQAAEQQERTAQALSLVALHFEQLNQGLDVTESRAELRQAEHDLGIASQLQQQYEGATQLQQQVLQSPLDLIAELEAELQRNPAMQQALSEISRTALVEARNALDYAATDDQNIQRANEIADAEFQNKKRQLAEDLREMGAEASRLSGMLVASAMQSAAQGKSEEAQAQFAQTQQKLNEAAAKANSARDDLLLKDLARTARETQETLAQAADLLSQAKQSSTSAKDQAIHADEKARAAQQQDSEKRRQQFHEQQKRMAKDIVKREEDSLRRSRQAVSNAEKQLTNAAKKVEQAREKLSRKPDDDALRRNVVHEEERRQDAQDAVDRAESVMQLAQQKTTLAVQKAEQIASKALPSLTAANPAAELAEQYGSEALQEMESLTQQASQLTDAASFGNELTPAEGQLATAAQQQQQVTQDVKNAAQDVARAARHERRLNNQPVVEPLLQAASQVEAVANNESTSAEQQLDIAASSAKQLAEQQRLAELQQVAGQNANAELQGSKEFNAEVNSPMNQLLRESNAQALLAQQDLATAEQAILQQADQLGQVLDPLLTEAMTAAAAQAEAVLKVNSGGQASQAVALTPAENAQGQQLARILDELDRLQAAGSMAESTDGAQPVLPTADRLNSLAQAARSQQAALAASRQAAQQQTAQAMAKAIIGHRSADGFSEPPGGGQFDVTAVNRIENANWGQLRQQSADDVAVGNSEKISEEYRQSIETYFRVLAERARKN